MVIIKREIWNKKFVVTVRERGQIVTWGKWNKDLKVPKAKELFKRNGTFHKGIKVKRETLKNVKEKVVTTDGGAIINNGNFLLRPTIKIGATKGWLNQYFVKGNLKTGKSITAVSGSFIGTHRADINKAREEAWENFFRRLSNPAGKGGYDEDEGIRIYDEAVNQNTIREGVRSFKER